MESWWLAGKDGKPLPSKYDLIANILHEGKAGEGAYRAHVHRKSEDAWYEVDDLRVTDILSQMVALSEAYMQIYELKEVQWDAHVHTTMASCQEWGCVKVKSPPASLGLLDSI